MKFLLLILTLVTMSSAIESFTYYWTINLGGDTATVVKWKNNNDSVLVWAGKVRDTLNSVIPRWNWFSNGDSTFSYMNIDTIVGTVYMDTIVGGVYIDTLYGNISMDTISGSVSIDSILGIVNIDTVIAGRMEADTAVIGILDVDTIIGNTFLDSLETNFAVVNNFLCTGTSTPDSVLTLSGSFHSTGNARFDSRVGIGTNNPERKLHIYDNSSSTGIAIESTLENNDAYIRFDTYGSTAYMGIDDSYDLFKINHSDGLSSTNHLVIDTNGNVGIGTITLDSLLIVDGSVHISGNARFDSYVGIGTNNPEEDLHIDGVSARIKITNTNDASQALVGVSNTNGGFVTLYDSSGATTCNLRSYNTSYFTGGYVGIGTNDPDSTLTVDGSGYFTNHLRVDGTLLVDTISSSSGVIACDTLVSAYIENTGNLLIGDSSTTSWTEFVIGPGGNADTLMLHSGGSTMKLTSYEWITSIDIDGQEMFKMTPSDGQSTNFYNYDTTVTNLNGFTFWTNIESGSMESTYGLFRDHFNVAADSTTMNDLSCDSITASEAIRADAFTTNGSDFIDYNDTTFYDSLYEDGAYKNRTTVRLVKIGRQVTVYQQTLPATLTGGFLLQLKGIPEQYCPATYTKQIIPVVDNGVYEIGAIAYNGTGFTIYDGSLSTFTAGTGGIDATTYTWLID